MIVGKRSSGRQKGHGGAATVDSDQFLATMIADRDFTGVSTFIDFQIAELQKDPKDRILWNAYALFHGYEFDKAKQIYEKMENGDLNSACCDFMKGDFDEAYAKCERCGPSDLKNRLMMHIAVKLNDIDLFTEATSMLDPTPENEISMAAAEYQQGEFAKALERCQSLACRFPEFVALHVYIAMCQFRLGQIEEADESLSLYLSEVSDSAIGLNLKGCIMWKMIGRDLGESQLLQIKKFGSSAFSFADAMLKHNLCIFGDGEDAFNVLPPLVSIIPEARLNLAIMHARNGRSDEAMKVMGDQESANVVEESLVRAAVLMESEDQNYLAIETLEEVLANECEESSAIELCKAIVKLLGGDYNAAIDIMNSLEEAIGEKEEFKYNKGMTLACLGRWQMAMPYLEGLEGDITLQVWKCRCFVRTGQAERAWDMYITTTSIDDSKVLLKVIATESYETQQYYYAMKAFDVLSKCDVDAAYTDGLIASAVGCFRGIVMGTEDITRVEDVLMALGSEPTAADAYATIEEYANNNNLIM